MDTANDNDSFEKSIKNILTKHYGDEIAQNATLEALVQHASARRYFRVTLPKPLTNKGESTLVAMVMPQETRSEEATSQTTHHNTNHDFTDIDNMLKSLHIRVPDIEFDASDDGILLLEDLGDRLFEDVLLNKPTERIKLYESVIDVLLTMQQNFEAKKPTGVWNHRSFEPSVLKWELMHFFDWALEARLPKEAAAIGDRLKIAFDEIVKELEGASQTLVLRDYQSRNIMQKKEEWVLIDFQDALMGPFCYDLVALLRDSYVPLFPHELDHLLDYYIEGSRLRNLPWSALTKENLKRIFYLQTLQRKLKDAGRFIFIREVKKNDSFVQYFEPSLDYVMQTLDHLKDPTFDVIKESVQLALSKPV